MLIVDEAVRAAYPGAMMGILAMRGVCSAAVPSAAAREEALQGIRRRYSGLDADALKATHPIDAYAAYYRRFGQRYHLIAQLLSVLRGEKTLDAGSGLLQAMFLTEMEGMLLTAGHDLSALKPPLRLKIASGGERYLSISSREVQTARGDLMLCDEGGVLSSVLRGPDRASRITDATTDALFAVYAPSGVGAREAEDALRLLEGRIRALAPDAVTEVLGIFA